MSRWVRIEPEGAGDGGPRAIPLEGALDSSSTAGGSQLPCQPLWQEGGVGQTCINTHLPLQALSWHLIHEQIPLSLDLQAGLDCCCLALQLPGLWSLLSSPEMVTHACSLIHCVRFILEARESMTVTVSFLRRLNQ